MRKSKRQNIKLTLIDLDTGVFSEMHEIKKAAVMEGVLAAHHPIVKKGEELVEAKSWVITHVPSGYSLGVPFKTQRHARKIMDKLLDLPGVDWHNVDPGEVKAGESAKKILDVLALYMMEEPKVEPEEEVQLESTSSQGAGVAKESQKAEHNGAAG